MTGTRSSWSSHPHSESNACMLSFQLVSSSVTQPGTQNLRMAVLTFRLGLHTSMKPQGQMWEICNPRSTLLFIFHCTEQLASLSPVSCLPGEMALSGGWRVGEGTLAALQVPHTKSLQTVCFFSKCHGPHCHSYSAVGLLIQPRTH